MSNFRLRHPNIWGQYSTLRSWRTPWYLLTIAESKARANASNFFFSPSLKNLSCPIKNLMTDFLVSGMYRSLKLDSKEFQKKSYQVGIKPSGKRLRPEGAIEPRHEISNNAVYATSKCTDQPPHTRSLIRAFPTRLNIL